MSEINRFKIHEIEESEGVVFNIEYNPTVTSNLKLRDTVLFVESFIHDKLTESNVYPVNNKIGLYGEIKQISFFISDLIEAYNTIKKIKDFEAN